MIEVLETDITTLEVDAISNAANTQLLHGGGVAAAISRAGGPLIDSESRAAAPIGLGEAVSTSGGEMPCKWVIHAATMELGGPTSADVIRRATRSTLEVASRLGARSLALVAFGTGVGGFPVDEAARIEVDEVRAHLDRRLVLWSASSSPSAARTPAARSSRPCHRVFDGPGRWALGPWGPIAATISAQRSPRLLTAPRTPRAPQAPPRC